MGLIRFNKRMVTIVHKKTKYTSYVDFSQKDDKLGFILKLQVVFEK